MTKLTQTNILSLDIETTGLDAQRNQVLSIGAIAVPMTPFRQDKSVSPEQVDQEALTILKRVCDQMSRTKEEEEETGGEFLYRNTLHLGIDYGISVLGCEMVALSMNSDLIKAIVDSRKLEGEVYKLAEAEVTIRTIQVPNKNGSTPIMVVNPLDAMIIFTSWLSVYFPEGRITVAGKNVSVLDIPFIRTLERTFSPTPDKRINFHHRAIDVGNLYFNPKTDAEIPGLQECLDRAGYTDVVTHNAIEDAYATMRCIYAFASPTVE